MISNASVNIIVCK